MISDDFPDPLMPLHPQSAYLDRVRSLRYSSSPVALADNTQHRFAADYALELYRARAIYTFIPKNGCSTLRYSTAIFNGCLEAGEPVDWIHPNNLTFKADLKALAQADYSFVFLRLPEARLISCFLDKFVDRMPVGEKFAGLVGRSLEDITFSEFVDRLTEERLLRANQHWRPQNEFLVYKDYDDWFSIEAFAAAERRLHDRIDFPIHDARALTRHGLDKLVRVGFSGEFANAPVRELAVLKRGGEVPSKASLLTPEIEDIIARLYAKDYALYRQKCL